MTKGPYPVEPIEGTRHGIRPMFDILGQVRYTFWSNVSTKGSLVTKIDDLDKKLVDILQENARQTSGELARQVCVSDATVRRRIEKLIKNDVIRIRAVADPFKLGYAVIVIIGLWVEKAYLRQAEDYVCALPEARFVGVTMGSYDLMLEAWFRSSEEMGHFMTETLASVPGIGKSDSFQVMRLSKYTYDWGKSGE
jgi:Lrp/AsnC family transcriptional regulator for asnA, asnC and gidA